MSWDLLLRYILVFDVHTSAGFTEKTWNVNHRRCGSSLEKVLDIERIIDLIVNSCIWNDC
jgi:hypothetical protein